MSDHTGGRAVVAVWAALYWLIDVGGHVRGIALLEGAGQNALTAYLIPYVLDALLAEAAVRMAIGGDASPGREC